MSSKSKPSTTRQRCGSKMSDTFFGSSEERESAGWDAGEEFCAVTWPSLVGRSGGVTGWGAGASRPAQETDVLTLSPVGPAALNLNPPMRGEIRSAF